MNTRSFHSARAPMLAGEDSPGEFLERCIETIEAREPRVHAFTHLDLDAARQAASRADARYRAGAPVSAIDGCPIGIKDIIDVAGWPGRLGSPMFEDRIAPEDAACVQALRRAGAVIVGKTHTTEFAIGRSPPTTNPHDPRRTPGGSSSGSAAAVGAGMLPVALGTQTVGSILRPASFCGAFGFKPSHGTLSLAGIHPLSTTLDHLGPIAASLGDAWAVAHAIWAHLGANRAAIGLAGEAPPDASAPDCPLAALHPEAWKDAGEASHRAFESAMTALRSAGAAVIAPEDDADLALLRDHLLEADDLNAGIVRFEMRAPYLTYRDRDRAALGERVLEILEASETMSAGDHGAMLAARQRIRERVDALRGRVAGFVSLASTGPAPQGLAFTGDRRFLAPWSLVGGPALSLPVLGAGDLPIGLQVMGFDGGDRALFGLARWMERSLRG